MSHLKIQLSQNTNDKGDYLLHITHEDKRDQLVAHVRFTDQPFINEPFTDELMSTIAREVAKQYITHEAGETDDSRAMDAAREETNRIIKRMQGQV